MLEMDMDVLLTNIEGLITMALFVHVTCVLGNELFRYRLDERLIGQVLDYVIWLAMVNTWCHENFGSMVLLLGIQSYHWILRSRMKQLENVNQWKLARSFGILILFNGFVYGFYCYINVKMHFFPEQVLISIEMLHTILCFVAQWHGRMDVVTAKGTLFFECIQLVGRLVVCYWYWPSLHLFTIYRQWKRIIVAWIKMRNLLACQFIETSESESLYAYNCTVCLNQLDTPNYYICRLPCGHAFHESCIYLWLINRRSCPNCRKYCKLEIINRILMIRPGCPRPRQPLETYLNRIHRDERSLFRMIPRTGFFYRIIRFLIHDDSRVYAIFGFIYLIFFIFRLESMFMQLTTNWPW